MNVRLILRRQYIAAILIALLTMDGVKYLLSMILAPLEVWTTQRLEQLLEMRSVIQDLGPFLQPPVLILRGVTAALYLLVAATLFRWIYWERPEPVEDPERLDSPTPDLGSAE
jgi:hypothetical protein